MAKINPTDPLVASTTDFEVSAAVAGLGVVCTLEEFVAPPLKGGKLVPVLDEWWPSFPGPFLYYPSRRHMSAPLRAFVDFIKAERP